MCLMASQSRLGPLIERILQFDESVDGLKTLAAGRMTGKLVVSLDIWRRWFGMDRAAWCTDFLNTTPRGFSFAVCSMDAPVNYVTR